MEELNMQNLSYFGFPTRIWFGPHVLEEKLPEIILKEKYGKALLLTDPGFSKTNSFKKITQTLEHAKVPFTIFSEVHGNPTEKDVLAGVATYKNNQCNWILGVGGGSPLDVAKAVRLMATHPGSILDYDETIGGTDKITSHIPPFVAIPTTSGTGSEVGRSSVITDVKTKTKKIIFSPHLLANWVIADPTLTVDLPAHITAATGMDALTHNIESYLAKGFHPMADGIALEGIKLVVKYLKRACENPQDIEARGGMLMASMMGAVAFQKGLGVTHSLAHPLSTLAGLHHGLSNGVMLVPAMKFNESACKDRLTEVSRAIYSALGQSQSPSSSAALAYLDELCTEIQIPKKLSAIGVQASLLEHLVEQAVHDPCYASNPKPVTRADFEKLYREAL